MLKEFDLDAPTLARESRQLFRHQTRCVSALYERLYKPFRIQQKAWKVLIEVVPVITKPQIRNLLGVLTFQLQGEPSQFLQALKVRKSQIALDWLARGVVEVAKVHDWPMKPFQDAEEAVKAEEFINKWQWKSNIWNKTKTMYCDVEIEHDFDEAKINAVFRNSDGLLIGSSALYSTSPSEFAFAHLLGKVKWLDECQVEIVSKDGNQKQVASVPKFARLTPLE